MRAAIFTILLALLLGPVSASAAPRVTPTATGGAASMGPSSGLDGYRNVTWDPNQGRVVVSDAVDVQFRDVETTMNVRRGVSLGNALKYGVRAVPGLGAAAVLADLASTLRCSFGSSGWQCDLGANPQPIEVVRYATANANAEWTYASTPSLSCQAYFEGATWLSRTSWVYQPESSSSAGRAGVCRVYLSNGSDVIQDVVAVSAQSTGCPGGVGAGADGRCPGGQVVGRTADQVAEALAPYANSQQAEQAVRDGLTSGVDLSPYWQPLPMNGPSSLSSPNQTVTSTSVNGQTQTLTTTTNYAITYGGDSFTYVTNQVTVDQNGQLVESTTSSPQPTCGVPGTPPCSVKVDETGTPTATPPDLSVFESLKAQDAQNVSEALSAVPEPSFGFIGAPPIVACRPVPLPNEMGEIDACNVVDTVRELMGFLWALTAAWISLGWIREAVNGG